MLPVNTPRHTQQTAFYLPTDSLAYIFQQSAFLVSSVLEGHNLTVQFEKRMHTHPKWPDSTRGAIRDLTWGTLRNYGEGHTVLAHFLHKPPPPFIHALLLVALHRLEQRPEHAHTTVNQAVSAAAISFPNLKGMVNGVLRNVLRQKDQIAQWKQSTEESRYKHPLWWINLLRQGYPDTWENILAGGNTHPPMSLRINPHKTAGTAEIPLLLQERGITSRTLENGALLLDQPIAVAHLPGYTEGKCSVQDAGAQWAAVLLNPQAGNRVLDACAAPGGKTAHLLEYAPVNLLALEQDPLRAQQIHNTLNRLGLTATVQITDCRNLKNWWDGQFFDCILADVPCSASGIVRRHPDIKWLRRQEDIAGFVQQQAEIIDALWQTLAPGGTMLYATCSVFSEENRLQVEHFCSRHSDAEPIPINGHFDWQLLPTLEHDGFYYARLQKRI